MASLTRQVSPDNNAMHAKPDLRVVLKWMIAGSGSVIADVIPLNRKQLPIIHCVRRTTMNHLATHPIRNPNETS